MPDACNGRELKRLRKVKAPGFNVLYQQQVGNERFRIKTEYLTTLPSGAVRCSSSGVVASIDAGQKAGVGHSYSVVQLWQLAGDVHLLLHQWREHAAYSELRTAVKHLIARYRPSAVLVEDTALGSAVRDEIRSRTAMIVHPIVPQGDKTERLRRHLHLIKSGRIAVPYDASWRHDFVYELTHFPYAGHDDQVDALTQYLDWITQNPAPPKRERPALGVVTNSRGYMYGLAAIAPDVQCRAGAMVLSSRRY
jgi:predicted phage terminase large subunit-like protein